jgi:peptidoglycan/LPS O-acetylase OafA/YrhL
MHLTFTQTLSVETYFMTPLNTVLWTVAIEVWFYVLFPFFAEALKRRPNVSDKKAVIISTVSIFTLFLTFNAISSWWEKAEVMKPFVYVPSRINQLPAFMGCYANGMLGAMIYVLITKHCERTAGLAAISTLLSVFSIIYIVNMVNECAALPAESARLWQVTERFRLTAAFMIFILSTALSARWYRFIFSNPLMRFLSGISYNLYIWHQWLAVDIKYAWRIPHWEGDVPPNQYWDKAWMTRYAIIITVAAFAVAIFATYCIEKPFAKLILGKPVFGKRKNKAVQPPKN